MSIGIIQGRLTPSHGIIQKFPDKQWLEEFSIAKKLGLDYVELLADASFNKENPLWTGEKLNGVQQGLIQNGLIPYSLCVDHIMSRPLTVGDLSEQEKSYQDLITIIKHGSLCGVTHFILPFLEGASLKDNKEMIVRGRDVLFRLLKDIPGHSSFFCIETDLSMEEHEELLQELGDQIGICYDTGNRNYFGYVPSEEIIYFGARIFHIHIKDKNKDGKNVLLGEGLVDFDAVFKSLATIHYKNAFTLETNRGDNEVDTAKRHLIFLKDLITNYLISKD